MSQFPASVSGGEYLLFHKEANADQNVGNGRRRHDYLEYSTAISPRIIDIIQRLRP